MNEIRHELTNYDELWPQFRGRTGYEVRSA